MAKDEFTLEQLDQMYDEASKWQPPSASPAVQPPDRNTILQKLLKRNMAPATPQSPSPVNPLNNRGMNV